LDSERDICSWYFFLLHDTKLCLTIFDPKKVTTLYHPHTLHIYLHQTIFCSPSWKLS
jgi:hypothetical protein